MTLAAVYLLLACLTAVVPGQQQPPPPPGQQPSVAAAAVPASRQADLVIIIPIHGPIDQVTVRSVKRRLSLAEQAGADTIIFELNTPGGQVDAALQICTAIKRSSITRTVAWINPDAYSAGVFIALACRQIIVSPACTLGDAAPIAIGMGGVSAPTGTLRAKIESPILAEIIDSARRRGYDEKLVQTFVIPEMELWLIENTATGDQMFVDHVEYKLIFGVEPTSSVVPRRLPPPIPDPSNSGKKIRPFFRQFQMPTTGAGGPLDREAIASEIEDAQFLPSSRPVLTSADRGQFILVEQVVDSATLLTIKEMDILRYGFGQDLLRSDTDIRTYYGAREVERFDASWSEGLTVFMTSFWVRGILIALMLLAALIEMTAPGVGLPGAVAIACLLVLLIAPALTGLASWWELAAILIGIILILAEVFVIPGFGVAGALGLALLFVGLIGTFIPNEPGHLFPQSQIDRDHAVVGLATIIASIFAVGIGAYFIRKQAGNLPIFNRMVLTTVNREPSDTILTAMGPSATQGMVTVGQIGRSITPLHPAGRAQFDDDILDVVCIEGFIDENQPIRVTEVSRFRIAVERAPTDAHT